MDLDPSVLWDFAGEVVGTVKPRPRGVPATVTRVDADGTVWVTTGDGTEAPAATCGAGVSVGDVVSVEWSGAQMGVTTNTSDPSAGSRAVGAVQRAVRAARSVADGAQAIANAIGQHFWADDNGAHVSTEAGNATGAQNTVWNSLGMLFRAGANNLLAIVAGSDSGMDVYDGAGNDDENVIATFRGSGARVGRNPTWMTVASYFESDGMRVRSRSGYSPFSLFDLAGIIATGGTVRQQTSNTLRYDWTYTLDFTPAVGTDIILTRFPTTVGIEVHTFVAGTAETYAEWYGTIVYDGDSAFAYTANQTSHTKPMGGIAFTYRKYSSADNPTLFVGAISDAVLRAARTISVGEGLHAKTENQLISGKFNDNQSANAFEIGNGTSDSARSNAFAVNWSGNVSASGDVTAAGDVAASNVSASEDASVAGDLTVSGNATASGNLTAGNFCDAAMTADLGSSGTAHACRIGGLLVMSGSLASCTVSDTYTWTHLAHLDPSALGVTSVTSMGATVEVSGGGPSYAGTTNAGGTARIVDGVLYAEMQTSAAFSAKYVKFVITAYVE